MWYRYRVTIHFECQFDLTENHPGEVVEHTFGCTCDDVSRDY